MHRIILNGRIIRALKTAELGEVCSTAFTIQPLYTTAAPLPDTTSSSCAGHRTRRQTKPSPPCLRRRSNQLGNKCQFASTQPDREERNLTRQMQHATDFFLCRPRRPITGTQSWRITAWSPEAEAAALGDCAAGEWGRMTAMIAEQELEQVLSKSARHWAE